MRGPILPFAPMKTYSKISVDLREKQIFSLSLSSLALTHCLSFLFFRISLFLFLFFFLISFYFLFFFIIFFFLVLSFPLFSLLDTWLNVSHSHKCTTCHATFHPTPDASKNMKFRLSRNLTKFDRVTTCTYTF